MPFFFFESCTLQDENVDFAVLTEESNDTKDSKSKICIAYKNSNSYYAVFSYKDTKFANERFEELLKVLNEVGEWVRIGNRIQRV